MLHLYFTIICCKITSILNTISLKHQVYGSPLENCPYRDNNPIYFVYIFSRKFTFWAPEYPANMVLYNTQDEFRKKTSAWLYQPKSTAWLIAYEQESSVNKETILYHRALYILIVITEEAIFQNVRQFLIKMRMTRDALCLVWLWDSDLVTEFSKLKV